MTKTMKLKWRLGKLPTVDEVLELINAKLITHEEAKEILFSSTEEDNEAFKAEIQFLRKLIERLSDQSTIVEKIRYIEKPYQHWGWYQPYYTWVNGSTYANSASGTTAVYNNESGLATTGTANASGSVISESAALQLSLNQGTQTPFSDIKTF